MGSYANSLHVRSDDAADVAAAIAALLGEQGWQPTERPLSDEAQRGLAPTLRGVQVSAPAGGWVSILDTDLMGVHPLAEALAVYLQTHAIFFLVNDSDSWSYLLIDPEGDISEFDSSGEAAEELSEGELAELGQSLQGLQSLMQDGSLQEKMQQINAQMMADAPPEMHDLEARMRSGQATPADMQRYQAWAMEQMPKYMGQLDSLLGGVMKLAQPAPRKKSPQPKLTKAEKAARKQRLDELRPLLAPGATDEQVQAALDKPAVFAEEVLAEFLPLLNINRHYAYLGYSYLAEQSPAEMAAQGIRFVEHLRFETDAPPNCLALDLDDDD